MAVRLVVRRSGRAGGVEGDAWSYEFEQARVMIGRGAGADVRLPELSVSERHATLERSGASYTLCDEGSTNGTRVGAITLVAARPRLLAHGDVFEVGPFSVSFEVDVVQASVTAAERTASLARRMLRDLLGPAHPSSAPPRLVVVQGPDTGLAVRLGEPPVTLTLGRGEDAGLTLTDADASRHHAALTRDQDGTTIRDLSSKNGLIINGKTVRERRLRHGDVLSLGRNALVYEDPATEALKQLDGQPDLTITRTQPVANTAEPVAVSGASSHTHAPELAAQAGRRSSLDTVVYVLSAMLLLASLAGLVWLFT